MSQETIAISANPYLAKCFSAGNINGLILKNRFMKAGTFENMTPGNMPSEHLGQLHGRLADGGIAMTTIGYCAVESEGRVKEGMMFMGEHLREQLGSIIADLHARGTKVAGQMGHGGGFSEIDSPDRPRPLGASFGLNALGMPRGKFFCDPMQLADIDAFVQKYHDAAVFMKSIGFDALEIHMGHTYGLCQFMSPLTNRRRDEYGGSLENRMRLPLRVLGAVREAVGPDFPLMAKISLTEGIWGGLNFDDAVEISKMLDAGGVDAIITSGGSSVWNPSIMFRGGSILTAMLEFEKRPLMRFIMRMAKPIMFRIYPYHELYFLEYSRRVKQAVACKMVYVGGASSNESFSKLMEEGYDFIQLGRTLLSDPDLPKEAQQNPDFKSRCTHCNRCIGSIENPQGIFCPEFGGPL